MTTRFRSKKDFQLSALQESQIYQDYRKAFMTATGLPLEIKAAANAGENFRASGKINPFCAGLMKDNQSCVACLAVQAKLEKQARLKPKTLKCFAGLCETAVPIRVGENLIAFLATGRVFTNPPNARQFSKAAEVLVKWGAKVDLKKAEEAYFNTKVLTPKQYRAMIRLLEIFSGHLASCAALPPRQKRSEPLSIRKARTWIEEHSDGEISLGQVARTVSVSAKYFSEIFSKTAGMPFVDYVGRVRVEKARALLSDPSLRIGEIALIAGFGSLSQFNRSFKKFTGQSPRNYRNR